MPRQTFFNLPREKQQHLLDCAIEEFSANDYENASISRVVVQAGIAKGSFYQYFDDKLELYRYLLELALRAKQEMLRDLSLEEREYGVFERLRRLFQGMIKYEQHYPQLASIGRRALSGSSPLPQEVLNQANLDTRSFFNSLIEEGKRTGEIRTDVDASIAALIFTSTLSALGDELAQKYQTADSSQAQDFPAPAAEIENSYKHILSILQKGMANPTGSKRLE